MKTQYIKGYKFVMDNYLMHNYDIILNEAIPNKWDAIFLVVGGEGAGKSTFTSQGALYLDNSFTLKHCEFGLEDLAHVIDHCPDGSSIMWDEAVKGARAAQHASKLGQLIISKLTQIRKKKLKIFVCMPYLYMFNKYFISRCVATFYVYAKGFQKRGYFFAYNKEQTQYLYALQKDKFSSTPEKAYKFAAKSFYGMFGPTFCLPESEYDTKKDRARMEENNEESDIWKQRAVLCVKNRKDIPTHKDIAKLWNVGSTYVSHLVTE